MQYRFPDGFVWASATAAIQIEGAAAEDGKGPSNWDVFCREHPERVFQQATPEVACDHYHRFREDVALLREIGHNGYRMSISWPRLFPEGAGRFNPAGADFYHRLFDCLLEAGIAPNVTLYHWDLPNALAQRGGWENKETLDHFEEYAARCFELYADRVKLWATVNEPAWTTLNGYVTALHPPLLHDYRRAVQVAHNLLVAHARVVKRFHRMCDGQIGIVLNMSTIYPASQTAADRDASRIADGVLNRWFCDPAILGQYPEDVLDLYRRNDVMPDASAAELALFREDTIDFIGVNYYYPHYASADATDTEFHLNTTGSRDAADDCKFSIKGLFRFVRNPKGRYTDWDWEIYPEGLYALLERAHSYRPGIPIYVTENGIGMPDELQADGSVDDQARIEFVRDHLTVMHRAIQDGMNVKGYYMWASMDNFSWINGYKKRYGFLYVDRQTQRRYKKKSAYWYRDVAANNGF